MRLYAIFFLLAAVLTISPLLSGQERQRSFDPDLLARLSLDNSGAVESESQGPRHICIAVDRDGTYRMMRAGDSFRMVPNQSPDSLERMGGTQRVEGTLSQEQFLQFKTLVGSSDLRDLPGNHGGIILQSAETFTAEIPVSGKQVSGGSLHIQWLNADGKSPFPPPVSRIADWLNRFEPKNAKPSADLEFQDVCPSVGVRLLQPSVASNVP